MAENKSNRLQIGIIIFNCDEEADSYEEIYTKKLQPINNFGEIIRHRFKQFFKKDGRHLDIIAANYQIYCGTETIPTIGREIDIYGEQGLYEFISLAKENNWKIFDKGLNQFLDLEFPKNYSYSEYKNLKLR